MFNHESKVYWLEGQANGYYESDEPFVVGTAWEGWLVETTLPHATRLAEELGLDTPELANGEYVFESGDGVVVDNGQLSSDYQVLLAKYVEKINEIKNQSGKVELAKAKWREYEKNVTDEADTYEANLSELIDAYEEEITHLKMMVGWIDQEIDRRN